jgi:hypothetical protein
MGLKYCKVHKYTYICVGQCRSDNPDSRKVKRAPDLFSVLFVLKRTLYSPEKEQRILLVV